MPADSLTTDLSEWPVVVHTTVGIPSMADVEAFIERADEILARRQKHAVVFDNRLSGRVPSYMRQRCFEWVKANRGELEQWCAGTALVVQSPALRFLMTTLMLVTAHSLVQEVFKDRESAVEWARRRVGAASPQKRYG